MKKIFFVFLFIFLFSHSASAIDCTGVQCMGNAQGATCMELSTKEACDTCCYKIPLHESIGDTDVIRGRTGMELLTQYISMIYKYGASILGIICVLIIVISGIQIIAGGAQADFVTQAKTRIMQALLSLAILFLSAVILKTINPGFFTLL